MIDRIIGRLCPAWALKRLQARQALAATTPAWDTRKRRNWFHRNSKARDFQSAFVRSATGDEIAEILDRIRERRYEKSGDRGLSWLPRRRRRVDDGWRRVDRPEDPGREISRTGWRRQ